MQELVNCPICAADSSLKKVNVRLTDHSLTGVHFEVSQCIRCEAYLTNPRPDKSEIGRYYDFPTYVSHSDDAPGLINRLYQIARNWTTRQKLALLERVRAEAHLSRKLLDYGCGTGFFLNEAQLVGWQVDGVEVNSVARTTASQRIGKVIESSIEEIPSTDKYDVITLWHVLEHIHELDQTVAALFTRLKPEGKMLIAVPNRRSKDAELYGEYWAAYDVPRHLYHFTPTSIQRLLERYGAKVVEQIGQPLDAFYIGLLSEKYRGGSPMMGLINGLRSTVDAWQTGNYSSLMYIVQREKRN